MDRAGHLRTDEAWLQRAWADPASRVLVVDDGRVPVRDGPDHPRLVLSGPEEAPAGERLFLGRDASAAYFAVIAGLDPGRDDVRLATLRDVGAGLSDRDAGLACHAVALANWHLRHPCCPRCGGATVPAAGGAHRHCPADGSDHFPRTDPAVIMRVDDGAGRSLLARNGAWEPGRRSVLAGFVEPGESAEQAVAREVAEEVGLRVESVRYLVSQPWPFPGSLMLAFVASARGPLRPDGHEVVEADWWDPAELAAAVATGSIRLPPPVSVARRLIDDWLGRHRPG